MQVPETQWLPVTTLESLAVVLTEKVFPPRSVVYYQGNEVEDVFFVLKGNVKVGVIIVTACCMSVLTLFLHTAFIFGAQSHALSRKCASIYTCLVRIRSNSMQGDTDQVCCHIYKIGKAELTLWTLR